MDHAAVDQQDHVSCTNESQEVVELPSCLEALVSSCEQLRQLSHEIGQYHIKIILSYCYAHGPTTTPPSSDATPSSTAVRSGRNEGKTELKRNMDSIANDLDLLKSMASTLQVLPYLNELSSLVERCFATIELTLRRCIYHLNLSSSSNSDQFKLPNGTKLDSVFISIMDLVYVLVSLDQTIRVHSNLARELRLFKSTCQLVLESNQQGLSNEHLAKLPRGKLEKLIDYVSSIQLTLTNEKQTIFQQCIEHLQHLELVLSNSSLNKGYKNLCGQFEDFLLLYLAQLVESEDVEAVQNLKKLKVTSFRLVQARIMPNLHMTSLPQKLFGIMSLYVLYCWLFKKTASGAMAKTVRSAAIQTLQHFKNINFIHLLGSNCYLTLDEFLQVHLPKHATLEGKFLKQTKEQREFLLKLDTNVEFEKLTLKVMPWLFKMKEIGGNKKDQMRELARLFLQGLELADEINYLVRSTMTAYLHFQRPMAKQTLIPLMRLIVLLKSIELAFYKNPAVNQFTWRSEQQVMRGWLKLMSLVRQRLLISKTSQWKSANSSHLLTIVTICSEQENLLSERGQQILALVVPMLVAQMEADEIQCLNLLLSSLRPPRSFLELISAAANCAHLFWQLPTFATYYNYALEENPSAFDDIHYFHLALNDMADLFRWQQIMMVAVDNNNNRWLGERVEVFLEQLGDELMEQFKADFMDKICQELEMELRLQTHRDLHLDGHNPFRRHLYNFKRMFASPNSIFQLFNRQLALSHYVEQHLNRVCYNLTAIAPHDWFTYDQMINLARHKYGLQLANSQLPTQTLDHGLDLLDITRNLALFVARYAYDLTNQLFIEKSANRLSTASSVSGLTSVSQAANQAAANCQLNVVQVRHIARSIQTHGYGLLNSSVNCSYQVMKRLVAIFAKQMGDERLRALLSKEQLLHSTSPMTFERANRIARRFRPSLPVGQEALAEANFDLDSVRQSITHLGNLLAFIRLLKSGALSCASRSVAYLPDLEDLSLLRLAKLAQSEFHDYRCRRPLLEASENFDQCLGDLEENFSPKTNYFGVLLNLFSESLAQKNTQKREHLKLFYLALPALTIHYVDHLGQCKERASSRSSGGRLGALVSDDGFPMGVAFLLACLRQTDDFARLEWFQQVRLKLAADKRQVEARQADTTGGGESLKQTSAMTLRRLAKLELEYQSLDYTLASAQLFFRSSALAAGAAAAPPQADAAGVNSNSGGETSGASSSSTATKQS